MSYLTIEEVADRLNMTLTQVRESRRKGEWPGNVGKLQGRRLRFNADLIESGPQEPTTTNDPVEAILWTLQGIEAKLAKALRLAEGFVVRYDLTPIDPYEETSP